jgi:ribonuclease P protein subunit RPR2
MGKKTKDEVPNPNSVANRDIIQRLNFLYQASVYLNDLPCEPGPSTNNLPGDTCRQTKITKQQGKRKLTTEDLSKSYVKAMKVVGKKTVVKMYAVLFNVVVPHTQPRLQRDPTVKRTICKGCNTVLVPGSTATIRVKSATVIYHLLIV